MSKRILFFGNERLATGVGTTAPVFRTLIESGYEIAALIVAQKESGPSRKPRPLEIVETAQAHDVPVLAPVNLNDAREQLLSYGAEAAVLVAYGKIVTRDIIDIFPKGIINIHPSLLPKHRGSTPIESVILNGEAETGVSIMRLDVQMDAGPIYAQSTYALPANISKYELAENLLHEGGSLLVEHLPAILDGSLEPVPQDESQATTDKRIEKNDGVLDWGKPAIQLEREIRAYLGWPRSQAKLGDTEIIVTKAHVIPGSGQAGTLYLTDKHLGIYTSKDVLIIDSLIPAGKKEMPAAAFRAGYNL